MGCCARFQRSFSALYHWLKKFFKSNLGISNWHPKSFEDQTDLSVSDSHLSWSLPTTTLPSKDDRVKYYGSKDSVEETGRDQPITPIYFASTNINIHGSQQSLANLPVSRKPPPGIATARISRLRFDSNAIENHDRHQVNRQSDNLSYLRHSSTTYSDLDAYTVWDSASDESVPIGELSFSGPILPYFSSPLPPLSSSSKSFLTDLKDLDPRLREASINTT
ncbi:hypothetical protein DFH28DRAFT_921567 [Melampsora americana]|nr:hypothetical protein DFH28DRAFT_921567 [Melampsora americana]